MTKVIQNIDPEASIITDPPTRKIEVKTSLSTEQVANALREAGFPPRE
ncbi:copper chaperone [Enterobacter asburiae]